MVLLDVLGKRWVLRLIWVLNRTGPGPFRALRSRSVDVSPTSRNQRLKDLRELGQIELGESGFALTEHGRSLSRLLLPLDQWSNDWASAIAQA